MNRVLAAFGVLALGLSLCAAAEDDVVARNTCWLYIPGGAEGTALELEITYLSDPVLEALFTAEQDQARIRAVAAERQTFMVRATARRPFEFYPTSLAFTQGGDRLEPRRSGLIALEGAFGGRMRAGESTRGLVMVPARLDLSRPLALEYASIRQLFLFTADMWSEGPAAGAAWDDPLETLELKVLELERRLQALEARAESSNR